MIVNNNKKLTLFIVFLFIVLFLRDTPYLNVFVINKIWILYIILFFFLFPPRNQIHFFLFAFVCLILALFITLFKFYILAEIFGTIAYFLLWTVVVLKIKALIK